MDLQIFFDGHNTLIILFQKISSLRALPEGAGSNDDSINASIVAKESNGENWTKVRAE